MTKNRTCLIFILFSVIGMMLGCQNKPCREIQAEKMAEKNAGQKTVIPESAAAVGAAKPGDPVVTASAGQLKIRVYKPDGTLQCGMGSKISLETMEKELKGIKVFNRSN